MGRIREDERPLLFKNEADKLRREIEELRRQITATERRHLRREKELKAHLRAARDRIEQLQAALHYERTRDGISE